MSRFRSPWPVLAAFLVIAAFFLLTEDRAHVFGVVPYLLLLACPLLHFLMHGTHRRRDSHDGGDQARPHDSPADPSRRAAHHHE